MLTMLLVSILHLGQIKLLREEPCVMSLDLKLPWKEIVSLIYKDGVFNLRFLTNIYLENHVTEFTFKVSPLHHQKMNSIQFQLMQLIDHSQKVICFIEIRKNRY